MKIQFLFCLMLMAVVSVSCVSKKKFAEAQQNYTLQDSLRVQGEAEISALKKELNQLTFAYQKMEGELGQLQLSYKELEAQSAQSVATYQSNLEQTQAELENKKRILEAFSNELEQRESKVKELNSIIHYQDSISQALFGKIEAALINFGKDELSIKKRDGKVYVSLSEQLLFQSGSANVNTKGRKALLDLADVLNKNPDIQVMIEGHTDNVPIKTSKFKDNWDLSVIRATTVVRLLVWAGKMDPQRLIASGRGAQQPIASNDTSTGRKQNRRTEIILSPDLGELMSLLEKK